MNGTVVECHEIKRAVNMGMFDAAACNVGHPCTDENMRYLRRTKRKSHRTFCQQK